jgi:hypothetical protein
MNQETKHLSTADLASAGTQPPPEPISERPGVAWGSKRGPLQAETIPNSSPADHDQRSDESQGLEAASRASERKKDAVPPGNADSAAAPLFEEKEANDLRARWNEIQVGFVDAPRTSVERADSLVAEAVKRLAESFAAGRQKLESEWGQGGDVSTETLRVALQRYRSFFNRLLSI